MALASNVTPLTVKLESNSDAALFAKLSPPNLCSNGSPGVGYAFGKGLNHPGSSMLEHDGHAAWADRFQVDEHWSQAQQ